MAEIKRNPQITITPKGEEKVLFDENHTLADFIRYLLTQTDRDEIIYLAKNVQAEQLDT